MVLILFSVLHPQEISTTTEVGRDFGNQERYFCRILAPGFAQISLSPLRGVFRRNECPQYDSVVLIQSVIRILSCNEIAPTILDTFGNKSFFASSRSTATMSVSDIIFDRDLSLAPRRTSQPKTTNHDRPINIFRGECFPVCQPVST